MPSFFILRPGGRRGGWRWRRHVPGFDAETGWTECKFFVILITADQLDDNVAFTSGTVQKVDAEIKFVFPFLNLSQF